jgi:hypothetical protein
MDEALETLVRQRAGYRCEYGHFPRECSSTPFEIDHIIAEQRRLRDRANFAGVWHGRRVVASSLKHRTCGATTGRECHRAMRG